MGQTCLCRVWGRADGLAGARAWVPAQTSQQQRPPRFLRRSQVDAQISATLSALTSAHSPQQHAVRFPHFTALRPIVVLSAPQDLPAACTMTPEQLEQNGPKFEEVLFVRGLVSTLLANAVVVEPEGTQVCMCVCVCTYPPYGRLCMYVRTEK